ncbi:Ig-like domain-containing protein, partial [Cellulomonas sp. P5_C5]
MLVTVMVGALGLAACSGPDNRPTSSQARSTSSSPAHTTTPAVAFGSTNGTLTAAVPAFGDAPRSLPTDATLTGALGGKNAFETTTDTATTLAAARLHRLSARLPIDRLAPTLAVTSPDDGVRIDLSVDGAVIVEGSATDTGSGVAKVEVVVDGTDTGDATLTRHGNRADFIWQVVPLDGSHTVVVRAFDKKGNVSSVRRTVTTTSPGEVIPNPDLDAAGSDAIESTITAATPSTLTVDTASSPVDVGNIVALGPTAATPQGALRRVVAVHDLGSTVVLDTVNATLQETFNELHVHQRITGTPPAPATSQGTGVAAATDLSLSLIDHTWANEYAFHVCYDAHMTEFSLCPEDEDEDEPGEDDGPDTGTEHEISGEIAVTAKDSLTFALDAEVDIDIQRDSWLDLTPSLHQVSFVLVGDQKIEIERAIEGSLSASAGASVEGSPRELLDKYFPSLHLPPVTVPTGLVPLVFTPQIELSLTGALEATASLEMTTEVTLHEELGVRYTQKDGWQGVHDVKSNPETAWAGTLEGEASVTGEAKLSFDLYDMAGPFVSTSITPKLTGKLETGKTPRADAEVEFSTGAGFEVSVLGFELASWSKPGMLEHTWHIWDNDGGKPTGDGGGRWKQVVSSDAGTTLGLTQDGTVYAWGAQTAAGIGNGESPSAAVFARTKVEGLPPVAEVFVGLRSAAVRTVDGRVFTWGWANYLGRGGDPYRPGEVSITDVVDLSVGSSHTVALTSDGSVWTWGNGYYGELGNGTPGVGQAVMTPFRVPGLPPARAVAASSSMTIAVTRDGAAYRWGRELNNSGMIDTAPSLVDSAATGSFVDVAAGSSHALLLTSSGGVWAWGVNGWGQTAVGTGSIALQVPGVSGAVAIAAGESGSVALTADGTMYRWGYNGPEEPARSVGQVVGLPSCASASTDAFNTWCVTGGGAAYGWGRNN